MTEPAPLDGPTDVQGPPAPSSAQLQNAALKGWLWTSLHTVVSLPAAVLVNIVVARSLGPTQFGFVATLTAAYGIMLSLTNFGIVDATVQWGSSDYAVGDDGRLNELARRSAGFHIFVQAPLIAVVTYVLLRSAPLPVRAAAVAAAAGATALGTASVLNTVMSRTYLIARVALATNIATQVAVAVAAVNSRSGTTTWTARLVLSALVPTLLFVRLPRELRAALVRPVLPNRWPPGFIPYAFLAGMGGIAGMLVFSRSEIFVLQAQHLGEAAGVFALAFGLAAHLTAPLDAVLGPLVPAAASLAAAAPDRVEQALLRGIRFTALAAGGVIASLVPTTALLIPLVYGERFKPAAGMLIVLGMVSCLQSLSHPITAFLLGLRLVGVLLAINVLSFALDMGIALAIIADWQAWGAVAANVVGQLVSLTLAAVVLARRLSIPAHTVVSSARSTVYGAVSGMAAWSSAHLLATSSNLGQACLALVVGTGMFALLLRLSSPVLTAGDAAVLIGALPRPTRRAGARAILLLRLPPKAA